MLFALLKIRATILQAFFQALSVSLIFFEQPISLITYTVYRTSKSKITESNSTVFIKEYIRWLNISMKDIALMQIFSCLKKVPQYGLYMNQFQVKIGFYELFEIAFTEF